MFEPTCKNGSAFVGFLGECLRCGADQGIACPFPAATPLEILSLAETRRRDPELAMAIATQAGQSVGNKERASK